MQRSRLIALEGSIVVALVLSVAGAAPATSTKVTVRVEGKTRTLLAPTVVQLPTGWITAGGVARGGCPAASGQGALNSAVHHHWSGKFSSPLGGYSVTKILGETDNGPRYSWRLFVDDRAVSRAACAVKPHNGETLLFAAATSAEHALALLVPTHASVGQTITGTVVYYNARGKVTPVAGALVSVNGHSGTTGRRGTVPLTPGRPGTYTLVATDPGYVRAAPVTLRVP